MSLKGRESKQELEAALARVLKDAPKFAPFDAVIELRVYHEPGGATPVTEDGRPVDQSHG